MEQKFRKKPTVQKGGSGGDKTLLEIPKPKDQLMDDIERLLAKNKELKMKVTQKVEEMEYMDDYVKMMGKCGC